MEAYEFTRKISECEFLGIKPYSVKMDYFFDVNYWLIEVTFKHNDDVIVGITPVFDYWIKDECMVEVVKKTIMAFLQEAKDNGFFKDFQPKTV